VKKLLSGAVKKAEKDIFAKIADIVSQLITGVRSLFFGFLISMAYQSVI